MPCERSTSNCRRLSSKQTPRGIRDPWPRRFGIAFVFLVLFMACRDCSGSYVNGISRADVFGQLQRTRRRVHRTAGGQPAVTTMSSTLTLDPRDDIGKQQVAVTSLLAMCDQAVNASCKVGGTRSTKYESTSTTHGINKKGKETGRRGQSRARE